MIKIMLRVQRIKRHGLFWHWAFCNVEICGSKIIQLLQCWLNGNRFTSEASVFVWNHTYIVQYKRCGHRTGLHSCWLLAPALRELQIFPPAIGNVLQEVSMCFMNQEYLPRNINHFPLFGRPHLCIEPSLKRHTRDGWRHLEMRYLAHLPMSKHI